MANSKEELLKWLALKPRTQGWGAVVSYTSDKCNLLLMEDYINKFTTGQYLPPIDKPVPTGSANWEYLSDWVTDAPRLSFKDSWKTNGGEVTARVAVVGGTQVSIDNVFGPKRAIAVKSIDALDHPELIAQDVALTKTKGTVDQDTGEVVLDLGDPENAMGEWELTFANTRHERLTGGKFFKKYYQEADEKKRLFHLGKIAFTDQQFLKPKSFILRTTTERNAQGSGFSDSGRGYVEMFVAMQGDTEGGTPPTDDWKSLIPDDVPEQFDSAILFGNKLLMEKVIYQGVRMAAYPIPWGSDFLQSQAGAAGFIKLVAKQGESYVGAPGGLYNGDGYTIYHDHVEHHSANLNLLIASTVPLNIEVRKGSDAAGAVVIELAGRGNDVNQYRYVLNNLRGEPVIPQNLLLYWRWKAIIGILVNEEAGTIGFEQVGEAEGEAGVEDKGVTDSRVKRDLPAISAEIEHNVLFGIKGGMHNVFHSLQDLDAFVVNSILFSNYSVVKLKEADLPGDLVVFGKISSLFTISPQEHLMGHSATQLFSVSNTFAGKVEWSVTAIPGSTGGIGEIDKDSGLYRAPTLGEIQGTFTRVKITATDPISKYSSSSLVTIVVRDITVNPVIESCNASAASSKSERKFSANTLGTGTLEWKVSRGNGSIPLRGTDGENTYTAALKDDNVNGAFEVDEIEVKNLATGKIQTSYVVVNHFPSELTVTLDMSQSSLPEGKAKFKAVRRNTEVKDAIWEVAEGSGDIDANGFYTADPAGRHRFALITARTEIDGVIDRNGWCITPLPLIELPDKPPDDFMVD
ncbi:hypothetical protein [Pseudomonas fluorescens]|uniref:hypothetical protein n=1 Tax=Pseudomonas fluorescens TaxID=294 RepID=UPI001912948C|nr:hypothetical protein [Pseudomonas fluorescens]